MHLQFLLQFYLLVKELSEENKQLEQGMKEILQAVKEMQKEPSVKGEETALIIPSLERLVNVSLLSEVLFSFIEFTGFFFLLNYCIIK